MTTMHHHLYTIVFPIRWADLDAYQHVNHAQFAIYMQEARIAWLDSVGLPIDEQPVQFPIVDLHLTFKRPLLFPGNVQVDLYSEKPEGRKWKIHHVLRHTSDLATECATGTIIAVCLDKATQKVVLIPETFYRCLVGSDVVREE